MMLIFFVHQNKVDSEFKNTIDLVLYVFRSLGFSEFYAQVSLRDPDDPKNILDLIKIGK